MKSPCFEKKLSPTKFERFRKKKVQILISCQFAGIQTLQFVKLRHTGLSQKREESMKLWNRGLLHDYAVKHASHRAGVEWFELRVMGATWTRAEDVYATFGRKADKVGSIWWINAGGNKTRIKVAIEFTAGVATVKEVLTHGEYTERMKRR